MPGKSYDVLVVGAGPAGMAAAWSAAQAGVRVGVIDDNPVAGGQIWRGEREKPSTPEAAMWMERIRKTDFTFHPATEVIDAPQEGVLIAESSEGRRELSYRKLIIATGARELFLPFPGWTLPNVMGAGGLQAMVKSGLPIKGKRVVIAGSGPLLLAVAAYLHERGADVRIVAEQTSWPRIARFGLGLGSRPGKLAEAFKLRSRMRGVAYRTGCWPVRAEGDGPLASVTLRTGRKTWCEPCDYLACGFGLVPNLELAMLLGCEIRSGFVHVNQWQGTTVPGVHCAGEPTGIGGLESALAEGQIAGHAATGRFEMATPLAPVRQRGLRFAKLLAESFALREELRSLPAADTFVCRCEDVTWGRVRKCEGWRAAKLQTRCGMGPCQGRVCGPAVEFLLNWNVSSVRPPIFPARVSSLYHDQNESNDESSPVGAGRLAGE